MVIHLERTKKCILSCFRDRDLNTPFTIDGERKKKLFLYYSKHACVTVKHGDNRLRNAEPSANRNMLTASSMTPCNSTDPYPHCCCNARLQSFYYTPACYINDWCTKSLVTWRTFLISRAFIWIINLNSTQLRFPV